MSKVCYTLTELLKGEKKIAQQWKQQNENYQKKQINVHQKKEKTNK